MIVAFSGLWTMRQTTGEGCLLRFNDVERLPVGTWILVAGVVLIAAFLQTSTGFGFSQVSVPILITVFAPRSAIQMTLILSLIISLTMLRSTRADMDTALLKRWVWSALVGIPVGIILFLTLPVLWIKVVLIASLGVAMLFLTLRLPLRRTARRDALAGFLSGVLTSSVGLPGPPLLVYASSANLKKSDIRNTTLTFHTVVYGFGIASQILTKGITRPTLLTTALLLAPLLSGIGIGHVVFPLLSQRVFKWLLYGILLCTELYLIATVTGVFHLL